jgi:hypothetical protein
MNHAYLQHGAGTAGPFRTEKVALKHTHLDNYMVRFEGRWRKVHIQVKRLFIVYLGTHINVLIEGV